MFSFDSENLKVENGSFSFSAPPLKKLGAVSFKGEANTIFCSPVLQTPEGKWRMYYTSDEGSPGNSFRTLFCVDSDDGEVWNDDFRHRIHCDNLPERDEPQIRIPSIFIHPSGTWCMFAWLFHEGMIRYVHFKSKDGINWHAVNIENPCLMHPNDIDAGGDLGLAGLTPAAYMSEQRKTLDRNKLLDVNSKHSNDSTFTYYNAEKNRFELYSVWLANNPAESKHYVDYDNGPGIRRIIQRRTSIDGISWSLPEFVVTPDEQDPDAMQFYYLSETKYEGWRVGVLGRYPCKEQIIEPEICFSRDGLNWNRPFRQSWIKKDGKDENAGLIHMAHHFVDFGDHWKIFYNSSYFLHNNCLQPKPKPRLRDLNVAELPKNRFLGLRGSGSIISKPFVYNENCLSVDMDIKGELKAELLDINGDTIPGHGFDNLEIYDKDKTCKGLRWHCKSDEQMALRCCRLRLTGRNITLYRVIHENDHSGLPEDSNIGK